MPSPKIVKTKLRRKAKSLHNFLSTFSSKLSERRRNQGIDTFRDKITKLSRYATEAKRTVGDTRGGRISNQRYPRVCFKLTPTPVRNARARSML